jgi:hypothetical protein
MANDEQHGSRMLDRALKTEPGGQRDATGRFQRSIAEIDNYQPEAAALQKQVRDPQSLLDRLFDLPGIRVLLRASVSPW